MNEPQHVFEWIAGILMTVILGMLGTLIKGFRDFRTVTSTFVTMVDTVLLGYKGSGGMIKKVDHLVDRDSALDLALEKRFSDERHDMKDVIAETAGKIETEMEAGFKRIELKLDGGR